MASSRQFDVKSTRIRTEVDGTPLKAMTSESVPEIPEVEVQQIDKVTLSPAQKMQVYLLNRMFGQSISFDESEIVHYPQVSTESLEAAELQIFSGNANTESGEQAPDLVLSQNYYYEYEETTFSASGTITLSDGSQTDFSFNLSYSREFESYSEQLVQRQELQDPLVINFSDQPMSLSTETVEFDLNMDGQMDDMPTLSAQAGFLALDKNNNGIIDDGSELFGAQTGDGFFELSQYDDNQDGFINEHDAVFSQLMVWQPGTDNELTKLSDTNVDTISLQNVETEFSFTDENNQRLGQMRQTSIYANQDGSVGSVHQIDLVI